MHYPHTSIGKTTAGTEPDRRRLTLFIYAGILIRAMEKSGRTRTSQNYTAAINSFMKFTNGSDIALCSMTPALMRAYESWNFSRGVMPNTSSFYMRILRAIYNKAARAGIVAGQQPFSHVYTGIGKTVKRALTINVVRKIRNLDLLRSPTLDYARDIFFLSFYLRGMSLVDMAFLRKSDLRNGVVSYCRRKTGRTLNIAWTDEMQAIVDKHGFGAGNYLLPIIRSLKSDPTRQYRCAGYNINRALNKIAVLIGLDTPLTLYVARHSWASIAYSHGISVPVITEALGHESEQTTRIYLSSLRASEIDKANSKIISLI